MFSNTRFQTILKALPRDSVRRTAQSTQAGRYDKRFTPRSHLIALLYGQLAGARSLRELEAGLNAQAGHHYHLGLVPVKRSTLADANQRRPVAFFNALAEQLMAQASRKLRRELRELVYLLDSTPIQLKGRGFDWAVQTRTHRTQGLKAHLMIEGSQHSPVYINLTHANINDISDARSLSIEAGATYVMDKGYYDYGWWHQIHQAGAQFVTRLKNNSAVDVISKRAVEGETVLEDATVTFRHKHNRTGHSNPYHGTPVRRLRVAREGKKPMVLVTNDMTRSAEVIAALYKQRWQIELFFKWLKQNLKLTRFLGRSPTAVSIQIYVALIAYLLLWFSRRQQSVQHAPLYLLLAELKVTLFERQSTEQQRRYREQRREKERLIKALQPELPL